jgi:hypothetical protein
MAKLSENQMARIATLTWWGGHPDDIARKLGIPADAVRAYRLSRPCLNRLARIAAYYAQAAKAEHGSAA